MDLEVVAFGGLSFQSARGGAALQRIALAGAGEESLGIELRQIYTFGHGTPQELLRGAVGVMGLAVRAGDQYAQR